MYFEQPFSPGLSADATAPEDAHAHGVAETPTLDAAGRPADPYDVIAFLLKKVEEHEKKIADQDAFIELQNQELEQAKAELLGARQELETQLADYDVLMQNTLTVEQELEGFKQKAHAKPTIQLPFYAEQKLAKLGYEPADLAERQAV